MTKSQLFYDNLKRLNEVFEERGVEELSEKDAYDYDLDYEMSDNEIREIALDDISERATEKAANKQAWRYEC